LINAGGIGFFAAWVLALVGDTGSITSQGLSGCKKLHCPWRRRPSDVRP
jgi:hypothetical protein